MEIVPLLAKDEGRRKEEGMLGHSGREGKVGEGDESGDITSLKKLKEGLWMLLVRTPHELDVSSKTKKNS